MGIELVLTTLFETGFAQMGI